MRTDVVDVTIKVVELMRQEESDLDWRLTAQAEALNETKCVRPVIGRIIDANDVKFLISALDLEDKDFAIRFSEIAHVTGDKRQRIISTIERHYEECVHCSLKRNYDIELDERIKKTCKKNNNLLLHILEEGGDDLTEGDHLTYSAHS
jgi:hypothetical protein